MQAPYQQHDGFSIFYKDITGDFMEMESNDKRDAELQRERRFMEKNLGVGGWLIEQVNYTEREEGCLLMLAANGERQ